MKGNGESLSNYDDLRGNLKNMKDLEGKYEKNPLTLM